MAMNKSPHKERAIILRQPDKRPYGVKVRFHVQTAGDLGYAEEVSVPLATGAFLSISPARAAPWEGGKNYLVTLEGFATATAAEMAGRRLVQALLWASISADFSLRLEYLSYEPFAVFERNRSEGLICEGYGEVGRNAEVVLGELGSAYEVFPEPDPNILLSMEIFCSAQLEGSQRAVFLALVSALEPLAQETSLGTEVEAFVDTCITKIRDENSIPTQIKCSLQGRLRDLKHESIRQAIKRIVSKTLPDDPEAWKIIDGSYNLRSQIIHGGRPNDLDIDLYEEGQRVAGVIRKIYAGLLNRTPVRFG